MPAAQFRSFASNSGQDVTALTVNKPSGVISGDVLYFIVWHSDSGVTSTTPSGWALQERRVDSTNFVVAELYMKVAGGSEPASYTLDHAGAVSHDIGVIIAYSNPHPVTPQDVFGGQTNTSLSTSATAPSITTTGTNKRVIGIFCGNNEDFTWTPPSGMTERVDVQAASGAGHRGTICITDELVAASGATGTRVATASDVVFSICFLIALNDKPDPITLTTTVNSAILAALSAAASVEAAIATNVAALLSAEGAVQTALTTNVSTDGRIIPNRAYITILEKNGPSEVATDKTTANIVYKGIDSQEDNSANPIIRPSTGQEYSYEKWIRLQVDGAFFAILNLRAYTDAANGLGTGVNLWWGTSSSYRAPIIPDKGFDPPQLNGLPMTNAFSFTSSAPLSLGAGPIESTGLPQEIGLYLVSVLEVEPLATAGTTPLETITFAWDEV